MGKFIKELFINRWDSNRKDIRSLATTKVESEHPKWFQMQISLTNVKANKPNVRAVTTLKPRSSMFKMMSVHISSGLVLHHTSDHNRSELVIQTTAMKQVKFKSCSKKLFLKQTRHNIKTELEYYFHHHIQCCDTTSHKVVRLGINPMIQPEPEDLPKDNPKLEIAVLRHNMRMLVKDTRSQDGIDVNDNDKGQKKRSQSMKEQAYNKEQRERPRPH
ncbi:hypothetical protein Tco_1153978 [Tanacetum coccineum]